jgi:hypothetical protein
MTVEVVDRYSATGTPTPNGWTICKHQCEGMGVYPLPMEEWKAMPSRERPHICPQKNEHDEWDFPPEDGYLFVWCEECGGTGRRVSGRLGHALDVVHTYYYAVYWPLWAAFGKGGRSFHGGLASSFRTLPHKLRRMWREQKARRVLLRRRGA